MDMHNFFIQLVLLLISARLFGELFAWFHFPAVVGEVFAGIIIGPSLFNFTEPTEVIKLLAQIGVVLLLFDVGLEADSTKLVKAGLKAITVALGGVIIPFILGFSIAYYFFEFNLLVSLFIGGTLTATSIGITVRVLADLKKQHTEEAQIVLGAAVLDDIIGIIFLSVLYDFSTEGGIHLLNVGRITLFVFLFLLVAPLAAKTISSVIGWYENRSEIPGLLPTMIISLILLFAWLAHGVGAPEILGGFAAGLALSKQFFFPFSQKFPITESFLHRVEEHMKPIIHIFTPIFFVTIGLSIDLRAVKWDSPYIWLLFMTLLLAAIIGKLVSGFLIPSINKWVKWAIGIAMIPRGEVGLIFVEMGRTATIFNSDTYTAMILVITVTTMLAPFAMRWLYYFQERKAPPSIS